MISRRRFLGLWALVAVGMPLLPAVGRAAVKEEGRPPGAAEIAVREAIRRRRTVRSFSNRPLERQVLLDLLWAAQGITHQAWGLRSAPSAGGTYPMEVHAVVSGTGVTGLASGVYRYDPARNDVGMVVEGDQVQALGRACLRQMWVAQAPASLLISAVPQRTTEKYGDRGVMYVHIEAGCVAENVFLMAGSLGLAAGIVGAFSDDDVAALARLPKNARPLLVMPVGYKG